MVAKRDIVPRSRNRCCNIKAITRSGCIPELNVTTDNTKILIYGERTSPVTIKLIHIPLKYFSGKLNNTKEDSPIFG